MKVRGGRALLNRAGHESTAAIVAEIEDTRKWGLGKDKHGRPLTNYASEPDYTFQISDCSRVISLDLRFDEPSYRRNNLHKIDTLIRTLEKFRDAVEDEQMEYEERERTIERNKNEQED